MNVNDMPEVLQEEVNERLSNGWKISRSEPATGVIILEREEEKNHLMNFELLDREVDHG